MRCWRVRHVIGRLQEGDMKDLFAKTVDIKERGTETKTGLRCREGESQI